jgi:hypothetical protein
MARPSLVADQGKPVSGPQEGRRGPTACLAAPCLIVLMLAVTPYSEGRVASFGGVIPKMRLTAEMQRVRAGSPLRKHHLASVGPRPGITCPARSVVLRPRQDLQAVIDRKSQGTNFCFKSKTYRLKSPLLPKSHDTFVGRYGAVLDGSNWHTSDVTQGGFSGTARSVSYVTIRNLVIRDMPQNGIATAYQANSHWTIDHNEVSGSLIGVSFPDYSTVTNNFIHDNHKYGFAGYRTTGSLFKNNEVAHNETCLCYPTDGGASKLLGTTNDSVIGNYIHDNGGNGIWFDTDNTGVLVQGNRVSVNTQDGKAIFMEQNDGTAIIRNNWISVGRGGEAGILINNSSNEQIYGNVVRMASTSAGGAIHIFFDASRTGYDTTNNSVHDNTVALKGSATIAASVSCVNVTDCSPFWTTKGNGFQANEYVLSAGTGKHWVLGSAVTWKQWRAAGFDTNGSRRSVGR